MPRLAVAAILAAASMAGLPFFLGFIGKELIYEATQAAELLPWLITAAAVLTNMLNIVVAGLVALRLFFGPPRQTPHPAHEAPWSMLLGPLLLSGLGLIFGLIASALGYLIVAPTTGAILAELSEVKLHTLPTSLNMTVLLSAITIGGGFALYAGRDPLARWVAPFNSLSKFGPEQWYNWSLNALTYVAWLQTRILQSGYLRYYLMTVIISGVILTAYTLISQGGLSSNRLFRTPSSTISETLIYLTILAATYVVIRTDSRLTAVAALGVVGYSIAVIFILFGAPDLAMTQFSIETLSVILLVLVLYKLPTFTRYSTLVQRSRDMIIALSAGAMMTILVLIVTALPPYSRLTPYFAENSLTLAKGHNVVNVILVDFRGFDTMGEITVLGIAAIGVYGLLKLRLGQKEE